MSHRSGKNKAPALYGDQRRGLKISADIGHCVASGHKGRGRLQQTSDVAKLYARYGIVFYGSYMRL